MSRSPRQVAVAEHIWETHVAEPWLTGRELAAQCGTSQANVSRTIRSYRRARKDDSGRVTQAGGMPPGRAKGDNLAHCPDQDSTDRVIVSSDVARSWEGITCRSCAAALWETGARLIPQLMPSGELSDAGICWACWLRLRHPELAAPANEFERLLMDDLGIAHG